MYSEIYEFWIRIFEFWIAMYSGQIMHEHACAQTHTCVYTSAWHWCLTLLHIPAVLLGIHWSATHCFITLF